MKKAATATLRRELGYLNDADICAFNNWTRATLANRRALGTAPPSSKIGRDRVTAVKDFHAWLARQKRVAA